MSDSSPAVFLSYASQDAEAAQRICDALRARGIEVWFDQNELRGGDAWDQKIRQQIRDCALFIPIISANTVSRSEGYFRLEWNLADQRTFKIARNRPFILPVCIDGTSDSTADVPESFQRVHWTRLPGGEPPTSFADRICELLSAKQPLAQSPSAPVSRRAASSSWKPVALLIAVVLAFAAGYVALNRPKHSNPAAPQASSTVTSDSPARPDAIPLQSIAVLPFVNMSPEKDQEYFSDGLSEELIGQLSRIPDLRVPARTSSFYFKGRSDSVPAIARALRVAHILEGSVRKSGSRLRVTAELIRVDNGYHLWSETYDRELKDVLEVQTDIATAVVSALKLKLSALQPVGSQRTQNSEAHNFYLLGRKLLETTSIEGFRRAKDAFSKAIALDPNYAAAYAEYAISESNLADITAEAGGIERAFTAAGKAIALAPDQAEGYAARGILRLATGPDIAGAQADLDKAVALNPADAANQRRYAQVLAAQGRLPEAILAARRASELDPLSSTGWSNLGQVLLDHGELPAALEATDRALEIDPEMIYALSDRGTTLLLQGRHGEALGTFRKIDEEIFRELGVAMAQHSLGHAADSQKSLDLLTNKYSQIAAYQIAEAHAWRGEKTQALNWLERAYRQKDQGMHTMKIDPLFAPLRNEPRYEALLRKMNVPTSSSAH